MNTKGFFLFDTYNTITADCEDHTLEEAFQLCEHYEKLLSKTIPGSDVWNLNLHAGESVTVSEDTQKILSLAVQLNHDSDGAFNIAVGELVHLWKVISGDNRIPKEKEIQKAVEKIRKVDIEIKGECAGIPEGISIDLGGIAKGYIADRTAELLKTRGVEHALINFGGNIIALGSKPEGGPWRVGLQTPFGVHGEDYFAVLPCVDKTVVTSGIYERGFTLNGVRYHHILDPMTGWPVQNSLLCAVAVGTNSFAADALTTAMFVLGKERGIKLAEKYGMQYLFLDSDYRLTYSSDLKPEFG